MKEPNSIYRASFVCRKYRSLKLKLLNISMCYINVVITSMGGFFVIPFLRYSSKAESPSMCLIIDGKVARDNGREEWVSFRLFLNK